MRFLLSPPRKRKHTTHAVSPHFLFFFFFVWYTSLEFTFNLPVTQKQAGKHRGSIRQLKLLALEEEAKENAATNALEEANRKSAALEARVKELEKQNTTILGFFKRFFKS